MFYAIEIPHQSPARLFDYFDERDFLESLRRKAAQDDQITEAGYPAKLDDAKGYFAHDKHTALFIESQDDYERAKEWRGHQWPKVQSLLQATEYYKSSDEAEAE